jgi:hypothetical protein
MSYSFYFSFITNWHDNLYGSHRISHLNMDRHVSIISIKCKLLREFITMLY